MSNAGLAGSIYVRVGEALRMIEVNTEQQDLPGIKNFTDLLEDYTSVYMEQDAKGKTPLDYMPNVAPGTAWDDAYEILRARRRYCLKVLREQNIFGYVGSPPIGDASAMKVTIGKEEPEELEA